MKTNDVSENINFLVQLLKMPLYMFKMRFSNSMNVTNPIFCKNVDVYEIKHNDLTIGCSFDEDGNLSSGIVFLNDKEEIRNYIDYCEKNMSIRSKNVWYNDDIELKIRKNPFKRTLIFSR